MSATRYPSYARVFSGSHIPWRAPAPERGSAIKPHNSAMPISVQAAPNHSARPAACLRQGARMKRAQCTPYKSTDDHPSAGPAGAFHARRPVLEPAQICAGLWQRSARLPTL
ncbi:hypothetical protein WOLCODRAFT_25375 [Wolfiporia cocos MD-104 SS10]|uniref:Uncharacterized protein n=1 Tax=Wolfiporia cocos (strain MD-104) TaxID=742152 RepID=A0A2H3JRB5_WOLCO|nr:hypothetical protein WOLCODRAFT_25375 [Wolfiporia cocos MD-104 SS10]